MKIPGKAQIEVSFNWIFVLIAGGAILIFFIMIANRQISEDVCKTSNIIAQRLESLLSAIQQNPEGVQIQDDLNAEIEFSCMEDGHTYTVKGCGKKAYLDSQIVFSPKIIGESKTIAWTQLYGTPYPVVQALYFTDEKTQYIFETDTRDYYQKFPEQFERKLLTQGEIETMEDEGFRKYIIITIPQTTLNLDSSVQKKSTIIRVDDKELEFIYEGDYSNTVSVPYVNEVTMFGGIISGDDVLYGCTMEKMMQLSKIVGEINLERTGMLAQITNEKCEQFFTSNIPQGYIRDIIEKSIYAPDADYTSLRETTTSLYNINRNMARANCPTIY